MRERNIELSKAKELLCGAKIERTKIIENVGRPFFKYWKK